MKLAVVFLGFMAMMLVCPLEVAAGPRVPENLNHACQASVDKLKDAIQLVSDAKDQAARVEVENYLDKLLGVLQGIPALLEKKQNRTIPVCVIIPQISLASETVAAVNDFDEAVQFDVMVHHGSYLVSWTLQVYQSVYQQGFMESNHYPFEKKRCADEVGQLLTNNDTLLSTLDGLSDEDKHIVLVGIDQFNSLFEYAQNRSLPPIACDATAFINYAVQTSLIRYIVEKSVPDPAFAAELNHVVAHLGAPIGSLFTWFGK